MYIGTYMAATNAILINDNNDDKTYSASEQVD
jgi:hypothetical protein